MPKIRQTRTICRDKLTLSGLFSATTKILGWIRVWFDSGEATKNEENRGKNKTTLHISFMLLLQVALQDVWSMIFRVNDLKITKLRRSYKYIDDLL